MQFLNFMQQRPLSLCFSGLLFLNNVKMARGCVWRKAKGPERRLIREQQRIISAKRSRNSIVTGYGSPSRCGPTRPIDRPTGEAQSPLNAGLSPSSPLTETISNWENHLPYVPSSSQQGPYHLMQATGVGSRGLDSISLQTQINCNRERLPPFCFCLVPSRDLHKSFPLLIFLNRITKGLQKPDWK